MNKAQTNPKMVCKYLFIFHVTTIFILDTSNTNSGSLRSHRTFDINQIKLPDTTGRYGTGLLTTYLLSRNLTVNGVLHYDKRGKDNFRKFSINLNRDAQTVNEMRSRL